MSNYSCELCGSNKYKTKPSLTRRLTPDNPVFEVVKCNKCGLHSLYPIPSYDDLTWIYSDYAIEGNRVAREMKRQNTVYKRKIIQIRKYRPNANKILDIGAGLGGFVSYAQKEGYEVKGVELEADQVKMAKEVFGVEIIHGSIDSFILNNKDMYDIITLHHVLEHLQHPVNVLKNICDLLNEGGLILIEVPNQFFNIRNELKYIKNKILNYPYNPYHHIYFYSPKTLKNILVKSGYNIVELNDVTTMPRPIAMIIKTLHYLGYGFNSSIEAIASYR